MAAPPLWAVQMLEQVLRDAGETEPVELVWRRSRPNAHRPAHLHTSGRAYLDSRRIAVTAGTDTRDHRMVLLHEIAHILTGESGHGRTFYETAWSLYGRYIPNVPRKVILTSEGHYRKMALVVAADMGIRGAKAALARRGA